MTRRDLFSSVLTSVVGVGLIAKLAYPAFLPEENRVFNYVDITGQHWKMRGHILLSKTPNLYYVGWIGWPITPNGTFDMSRTNDMAVSIGDRISKAKVRSEQHRMRLEILRFIDKYATAC